VGTTHTIPTAVTISADDICGLWEVIRISRGDSVEYPWTGDRFKYSFQPEMNFSCLQNGKNSTGTWKLLEKIHETQKRYYIILNETFEYAILDLDEDEITLSDHINKYLLVRRL